jgi:MraZ protein
VEAKLEEVNKFSREGRTVLRSFLRTAEDVTLDEQNRIALPKKLMEYAGITERCVFIGSGEYIEIWSPEVLERADSEIDNETLQALYEKVLGGRE